MGNSPLLLDVLFPFPLPLLACTKFCNFLSLPVVFIDSDASADVLLS